MYIAGSVVRITCIHFLRLQFASPSERCCAESTNKLYNLSRLKQNIFNSLLAMEQPKAFELSLSEEFEREF
jgi:hypothetical protein